MESVHTIYSDKRKSGIPLIGDLPWGSDFCQFYQTEKDLIDILVPYFKAGLESNELCLWITSGALSARDARKALKEAVPDLEDYTKKGQMEIISQRSWRAQNGNTDGAIISNLDKAISNGFDGLRLACNAFPERKRGGKVITFDDADVISRYNIIAVCSYPRDKFDAVSLMETVKNHRFALIRNADRWELIESLEARIFKDALKRSEEKLHSLFSNMSEGFAYHRIVLDASGNPRDYVFHEVNEAFERLTGLKREKVIGKRATEVLPGIGNNSTDWIGIYGQVALTGEPVHFESYSESLERWYSVSAFSPHKGYFAVTFSDITERKRMEQALRESEEKLRVTLTSIGDAVIATDAESRITFINPVAAALTGWEGDEARGRMIEEVFRIINEETRKPAEDIVRRVLREGHIAALANHTALITRDGREIPIEDSAAPIRGASGEVSGVVLVFHDVTEQRRAQAELRESHDELELRVRERTAELRVSNKALMEYAARLERLNEELQEFTFVASHDLQEPLRKIQTFCDMALKRCTPALDDAGQKYLERVITSAGRMRQLLYDLLQFSKMAAKPEPFREIDLSKTVREASDLFKEDLQKSGGLVEIHNMPSIDADEGQMLRLFQNLIGNALKFRNNESPRIKISAKCDGQGWCEIYVQDNGIGFDQRFSERIFKPFQRLHNRDKYEGTGMGLSICRKIVDRHSGRIRAESESGKGSTFIIRLPMKQHRCEGV